MICRGLKTQVIKTIKDESGRFLILQIKMCGVTTTLVNCYGPNSDSPQFYTDIFQHILTLDNHVNIILGGDLNITLSSRDVKGTGITNPKAVEKVKEYMAILNMVDVWRLKNENKFQFTWKRTKPKIILERLDYILLSDNLLNQVKSVDIQPAYQTDHSFPTLEFLNTSGKKSSYWKLNTNFLLDAEFNKEVENIVQKISEEQKDIFLRWELIKMEVRGFAIQYGTRKKKSKLNELSALNKKLKYLESEQADMESINYHVFDNHEKQIFRIKQDIERILENSTSIAINNCKNQWYDEGEKCTKYFLGLENSRNNKRDITAIKTKNGDTTFDEDEILVNLSGYYEKLYTSNGRSCDTTYLDNLEFPTISLEQKNVLDENFTKDEIKIAIMQIKEKKCPGLDGFPIEFYKKFWNILSPTLHSLYMKCFSDNKMNPSAKEGVIALLDKPNRDLLEIKNWRPLTMLNCDYKIFSKMLANRLQLVLPILINEDQKGFMKGRNTSQNLKELLAVIEYFEDQNIPGYVMSLDFEKAFDKCEWAALKCILRKFNFGNKCIDLILLCLSNFKNAVFNRGKRSDFFVMSPRVQTRLLPESLHFYSYCRNNWFKTTSE